MEMRVRVVLMIGLQHLPLGSVTGKFLQFQLLIAQEVFVTWSILGYCFILLAMTGRKMDKLLPMTFG